jgi:formylglycine-generating enzyme
MSRRVFHSRSTVGVLRGALVAGLLVSSVSAQVVTVQTVPVGNLGNAADAATGYGAVNHNYSIGKYDVTAGQYTAFLNAVAATDTYGLYNPNMANPASMGEAYVGCGITHAGSPGNYTYSTTKDPEYPVNYVSFWDACRFANWLNNGQGGAETTEYGAYALNGVVNPSNRSITRDAAARWAISTHDEWYKAAYFDPVLNQGSGGYWSFATRSSSDPSNVLSSTGTNNANFYSSSGFTDPVNYLTPVGAFAASPSAYGTFDQAGNVYQWTDTIITVGSPFYRVVRGGSFEFSTALNMQSGVVGWGDPASHYSYIGFRVSQVPEPASLGLLGLGAAALLRRRQGRKTGSLQSHKAEGSDQRAHNNLPGEASAPRN